MRYFAVWLNVLAAIANAVPFVWTGNWWNGVLAVLFATTASVLYLSVRPTKESR